MRLHTWGLATALRSAGLTVVETAGWAARTHGDLPGNPTVVWHHDASPSGDSPGALTWMVNNWDNASAQIWVDRSGKVHLVGSGVAWHAGRVLPGMSGFDNYHSVGIETDHTVGEAWPAAQLTALRLTTAVILDRGGRSRGDFQFHRLIASPVGRKVDPAGLELAAERVSVHNVTYGADAKPTQDESPADVPVPVTAQPPKDDQMAYFMYSTQRPIVLVDGNDVALLSDLNVNYDDARDGFRRAGVVELNFGDNHSGFDALLTLKGKADLVTVTNPGE